jgi:hypothetical protein
VRYVVVKKTKETNKTMDGSVQRWGFCHTKGD